MTPQPNNLEDAINKALATEGVMPETPPAEGKVSPKAVEEPEGQVPVTPAPGATEPTPVEEPTDEQTQNVLAQQLWAALRDPAKAPIVTEFLAKQAGFVRPPATVAEVIKQSDSIEKILSDALGEELAFLAPKLGPALDKILKAQLDERLAVTNERIEKQERVIYEQEAGEVITDIATRYFDDAKIPADVEAEMSKLMDKIQPTSDMTTQEYLETIFYTVAGKRGLQIKKAVIAPNTSERTTKNRTDASVRLASERGGTKPAKAADAGSTRMTLNESIEKAIEEVQSQKGS